MQHLHRPGEGTGSFGNGLLATLWLLGIEPEFSVRAPSALNHEPFLQAQAHGVLISSFLPAHCLTLGHHTQHICFPVTTKSLCTTDLLSSPTPSAHSTKSLCTIDLLSSTTPSAHWRISRARYACQSITMGLGTQTGTLGITDILAGLPEAKMSSYTTGN